MWCLGIIREEGCGVQALLGKKAVVFRHNKERRMWCSGTSREEGCGVQA